MRRRISRRTTIPYATLTPSLTPLRPFPFSMTFPHPLWVRRPALRCIPVSRNPAKILASRWNREISRIGNCEQESTESTENGMKIPLGSLRSPVQISPFCVNLRPSDTGNSGFGCGGPRRAFGAFLRLFEWILSCGPLSERWANQNSALPSSRPPGPD